MTAEPIAIVGRSCLLPGAADPESFWAALLERRVCLRPTPPGRWAVDPGAALADVPATGPPQPIGGYVTDRPAGPIGELLVRGERHRVDDLDPVFDWTVNGAARAMAACPEGLLPRTGLVVGHLSYPTTGFARWAQQVWSGTDAGGKALDRFMSGAPALLAARSLGLGAGSHALDAACASSLYAVKLACDRLRDRTADLMIAGGVSRPDDVFVQLSFRTIGALSRSGRCRPFHREADGLLSGEGAAFVALMRLDDAIAAGLRIHGVVRGVGLSNDGRGAGLLVPSAQGQIRAMQAAYAEAGVDPATVGLLQCHATGTPVGDAVELRSSASVFADSPDLPVGSVKGNVGHLLTAAGAAGLIAVLGALENGIRPPSVGADDPLPEFAQTVLRPLAEAEDWPGHRRAAVSAFGFGGNNAHLIVDAWTGDDADGSFLAPNPTSPAQLAAALPVPSPVAVVAAAAVTRAGPGLADLTRALLAGTPIGGDTRVQLDLDGLRFPPLDLQASLSQQTLLFQAARDAARDLTLPPQRTLVVAGMGCDPEAARPLTRWLAAADPEPVRDALAAPQTAAGVLGSMPNVVANRINAQLDLSGPGFTVSAEEASGTVALDLACRALRAGEVDAALIGAVDRADDPVHRAALRALTGLTSDPDDGDAGDPGDAAIVLILRRLDDARREGETVLAVLDPGTSPTPAAPEPDLVIGDGPDEVDPARVVGRPHAAAGLLGVLTAVIAVRHRALLRNGAPAVPALDAPVVDVVIRPLAGPPARYRVLAGAPAEPAPPSPAPAVQRRSPAPGPRSLGSPPSGQVAFVYAAGSMTYPLMGRELLLAFPDLLEQARARCGPLRPLLGWAYGSGTARHALDQILGAAVLAQVHTAILRDVLGLTPDATIGYSSGELSALIANGVWPDATALTEGADDPDGFAGVISLEQQGVRRAWQQLGVSDDRWATHLVQGPLTRVREAVQGEPGVHVMVVNAPDSAVIGGPATGCARVLARMPGVTALPIAYDIAAHVPELAAARERWLEVYRLPVVAVPGLRVYSCAYAQAYQPSEQSCASALTDQMLGPIDFAATIERAWQDGVRVFVEQGPRNLCAGWIRRTLADRDHLVVSLDGGDGRDVHHLLRAVDTLASAGVVADPDALRHRLTAPDRTAAGRTVTIEARPTRTLPAAVDAPELTRPSAPVTTDSVAYVDLSRAQPVARQTAAADAVASLLTEQVSLLGRVQRTAADQRGLAHREFLASRAHAALQLAQARARLPLAPARSPVPLALGTLAPPSPPHPGTPAEAPASASPDAPSGPALGPEALLTFAEGSVQDVFGAGFSRQDGYPRRIRLPKPPLLMPDRVLGMVADPAREFTGSIWTQTDVALTSWFLDDCGRMMAGPMAESGQAVLVLLSWLGADHIGQGERVYRLLGCTVTFHGEQPRPGDVLDYRVEVTGMDGIGSVPLFSFRLTCHCRGELRMSVEDGRAGLFTDTELTDGRGLTWDAAKHPAPPGVVDPPLVPTPVSSFDAEQVRAFAQGRPADCFGPDLDLTRTHVRTPRIPDGDNRFVHTVTHLDPAGGPWGRGLLRADMQVRGDEWFFAAHFPGDPCMPGTLMSEGCFQALAFYLTAMGATVNRDGWRFEPTRGAPATFSYRGQVTPGSRTMVYEVHVTALDLGPAPSVTAEIRCIVDGKIAFLASGAALSLVPDWPHEYWSRLGPAAQQLDGTAVAPRSLGGLAGHQENRQPARIGDLELGREALLACAWGRPSEAFGAAFAPFDSHRHVARLPAPPFLFADRVVHADEPAWQVRPGTGVIVEYDVPDRVWYFEQNDRPVMPLAVLMEVALQATGWLAGYLGTALASPHDLLFRNLDATAVFGPEVSPGTSVLQTEARLISSSDDGRRIVQSYSARCLADGVVVCELSTTFGFFPRSAFDHQPGLPTSDADRELLTRESAFAVDLVAGSPDHANSPPRMPGPMLLMLDRVTGYWPEAGAAGLGRLRAEKDIEAKEWFFAAHFFQDPVQPGSLGVQAICQLAQFYLRERGLIPPGSPGFVAVTPGRELRWRYRGQVTPRTRLVTVEVEIVQVGPGAEVVVDGWLWADGVRIYEVRGLGIGCAPPGGSH